LGSGVKPTGGVMSKLTGWSRVKAGQLERLRLDYEESKSVAAKGHLGPGLA
jgi:hypothetical protein